MPCHFGGVRYFFLNAQIVIVDVLRSIWPELILNVENAII